MQIYIINHTASNTVLISCESLKEAKLFQSAYNLTDSTFISIVPIAKKSLIDSINVDNCFNLLCKVAFFGLPCLVGYLLLNF